VPRSPPIFRTPDDRFRDLPGYAFEPHYLEHDQGLRMHFLQEDRGEEIAERILAWS
jgi:haloalkane dehalogenase